MFKANKPTHSSKFPISKISKDFSKASGTYNSNASVQKIMAKHLLDQIVKSNINLSGTTLDLGSGTGHLGQEIKKHFPEVNVIPSDISKDSLLLQDSNTSTIADFSKLPFIDKCIQNSISNAALQWSPQLESSFEEINRTLKKGSFFCFTLLGTEHFAEIETAYQLSGLKFTSPIQKHSIKDIQTIIKNFDWTLINSEEKELTTQFKSLTEMLRHFKDTGVRANQNQPFPFKNLNKNWPKKSGNNEFQLTWNWHSWIIQIN